MDRLARKSVLQALILEKLERFGVKAIFLEGGAANNPLSKLTHQIMGAVAESEPAKIAEGCRRSKLYRARCGEDKRNKQFQCDVSGGRVSFCPR
jgi:DNA invertase Pin-like site-specific DNA recombinase